MSKVETGLEEGIFPNEEMCEPGEGKSGLWDPPAAGTCVLLSRSTKGYSRYLVEIPVIHREMGYYSQGPCVTEKAAQGTDVLCRLINNTLWFYYSLGCKGKPQEGLRLNFLQT